MNLTLSLLVARRHHIPIVSDEMYAEMVFKGEEFHSIASVATDVPVLVCGGISKQFLVPGWRLGWILLHNQIDAFTREVCCVCECVVAVINMLQHSVFCISKIFLDSAGNASGSDSGGVSMNSSILWQTLPVIKRTR